MAVCRMAVRIGIPIESLTSLKALVEPAVATRLLDAYWRKDGEEPKVFTIDLASRFLALAREAGFDEAALAELDDMRAALEEFRRAGLTPKNLKLVRQVLTDGIWSEVLNLPTTLMSQAHGLKDYAPVKAAVTAQLDGRPRNTHRRPRSPGQSDPHPAGGEPDQARRLGLTLLAGVSPLRREEPSRPELQIG